MGGVEYKELESDYLIFLHTKKHFLIVLNVLMLEKTRPNQNTREH